MRPLRLTMKGLNSFKQEQTVDFEELSSHGIFGIFGPTGSGKSTILDAVTLALYGETARKSSSFVNSGEDVKEAGIVFRFQISGSSPRIYQVERRYIKSRDASKKPRSQSALKELTGGGEQVLEEGTTAVTACCERLIGLKKEDFLRTVLLPQGKFSEFLMLAGKERNEMLERLFNLEQYGERLAERVGEEKRRLALASERLNGRLLGYEDAGEEALLKAEESLARWREAHGRLEQEEREAGRRKREAELLWERLNEKARYEKALADLDAAGEKMEAAREEAALAEEVLEAEPAFLDLEEKEKGLASCAGMLQEAEARVKEAAARRDAAGERLEAAEKEEGRIPELNGWKGRLESARPGIAQRDRLKAKLREAGTQAERLRNERKTARRELEEAARLAGEARREAEALKAGAEDCRVSAAHRRTVQEGALLEEAEEKALADLAAAEAALDQRKRAALTAEEEMEAARLRAEEAEKRYDADCGRLEELLAQACPSEEEVRAAYEELADWKSGWEKYQRAAGERRAAEALCARLAEALRQGERKREQLILERERLREEEADSRNARRDRLAKILRETLSDGETCPVCGSGCRHWKLPEAGPRGAGGRVPGAEEEDALLEEMEQGQARLEQNQEQILRLEAEMAADQARLEEAGQSAARADGEISRIPEPYRASEPSPARYEELGRTRARVLEEKTRLEKAREESRREAEKGRAEYAEAERVFRTAAEREEDAAREAAGRKRQADERRAARLGRSAQSGIASFREEQERVSALDRRREELEAALEGMLQKAERLEAEKDQKERLGDRLCSDLEHQEGTVRELEENLRGQEEALSALLGPVTDVEGELCRTEAEIARIQAESGRARLSWEESGNLLSDAGREEAACRIRLQNAEASVREQEERARAALDGAARLRARMAAGDLSFREAAALCRRTKGQIERMKAEIAGYEEERARLESLIREKEAQTGGACLTREEWERQRAAAEEAGRRLKESAAQGVLLKAGAEESRKRLEEKRMLEREKRALEHESALVSQLERLVKGKRFVEYAAREKLQYVSREASDLLRELTFGTYELECGSDGRFAVIDYKNGGVRRGVNTLSGGEVFLASLALALALSNQIQLTNHAPLELFFLDEGFGTLDDSLLDTVMEALEHLHSLNRRAIGLITHVEKIQSQIPVKLMVRPAESGVGGSRVELAYS